MAQHAAATRAAVILKDIGEVHGPFRILDATGVYVLMREAEPHPAGSILIPNRTLRQRSPNHTTHMSYLGLYEAYRAGSATVRHAGMDPRSAGEIRQLVEDIHAARSFVRTLCVSGAHHASERGQCDLLFRKLIREMRHVWNPRKAIARRHFQRGLRTCDRLGRHNPAAAGFATGAGIQQLLDRQEDIRAIAARVDRRTMVILAHIDRAFLPFQELRRGLEASGSDGLFALAHPSRPEGMKLLTQRLDAFALQFRRIWVLPFTRNAILTEQDLRQATQLARDGDRKAVVALLRKIKRGIAWAFALHVLEMDILSELSFTLDEMAMIRKTCRSRKVPHPDAIVSAFGAPHLERIHAALRDFDRRLARCSDEGLKHQIKLRIQECVTSALQEADRGAWPKVKRYLKIATAML